MRCVTAAHPAAIITDHSRCTRALSCLPMTSFASVRLLLHRRSSLVWCLLAIFNNVLSIDQLAKIHHARHGEAAPAIGGFFTSSRRERASSGSWTSGTARRRPGAQLGDAACVVGGGVGRVCDDGVDPATGADGWGMQETSTPPSMSIAPCPIFARRARPMLKEMHSFAWCREKFYDSKMSHTAPITQTHRLPHTQTVFIHRFEFLSKSIF